MRVRLLVVVLAGALAVGLGLGFASDPTTRSPEAMHTSQPPSTVEVEVLGKVVQPAPTKDVVDVDALPRTGGGVNGIGLLVGLLLVGLGLAAIDVAGWLRTRRAKAAWRRAWVGGPWHLR
jgi:hypothetical protein